MTKPDLTLVNVSPSDLPAKTLTGVIWSPVISSKTVKCKSCVLFEICRDAVTAGNFAGCEGMLESEIWHVPEEVVT